MYKQNIDENIMNNIKRKRCKKKAKNRDYSV